MSAPLTELEWSRVFDIRCRSRRGQPPTEEETRLIGRAFAQDKKRYVSMSDDVFDETVPAGSFARARRKG